MEDGSKSVAVGRNRWTRAIQRVRRGADRNTVHEMILAAKGQSACLTHEKSNPVTISTVCNGILPLAHTSIDTYTQKGAPPHMIDIQPHATVVHTHTYIRIHI